MTKGEIAKNLYQNGLNCSQAVVLAFKEEINLPEQDLKKLAVGFGGGFGRQGLVCGAICGMTMVLSYLKSDGNDKLACYAMIKEACTKATEKLGSLDCKQLKKKSVSCDYICQVVADITQTYLA